MADDIDTRSVLKIIPRDEAKSLGLKKFSNGVPCRRGHDAERYVATGLCVACGLNAGRKWREQDQGQYQKEWRKLNPEKARLNDLKSAARNKSPEYREKRKGYDKKSRELNKDQRREFSRRRRARQNNAEGNFTEADVLRILSMQRGKCACCSVKLGKKYQVDHIIPLSRGGSNWPANLQILCQPCNGSKWSRDPVEFMQSRGLLL